MEEVENKSPYSDKKKLLYREEEAPRIPKSDTHSTFNPDLCGENEDTANSELGLSTSPASQGKGLANKKNFVSLSRRDVGYEARDFFLYAAGRSTSNS